MFPLQVFFGKHRIFFAPSPKAIVKFAFLYRIEKCSFAFNVFISTQNTILKTHHLHPPPADFLSAPKIRWILAQVNIYRKVFFVFITSVYTRKVPQDDRMEIGQACRILMPQNSTNLQKVVSRQKMFFFSID